MFKYSVSKVIPGSQYIDIHGKRWQGKKERLEEVSSFFKECFNFQR